MSQMHADLFRSFRKNWQYRTGKRMTRADLARLLEVHVNTVHNIESGKRNPNRITEQKFSALTARHQGEASV